MNRKTIKLLKALFFIVIGFSLLFSLSNDNNHNNFHTESSSIANQQAFTSPLPRLNDTHDYSDDQFYLDMINVFDAWELETGTEDVMVAIVDTGIDTDHEEFIGKISELSYNVVTEEVGRDAIEDIRGHGTAVAGVIGANRNNNIGIKGLTDNVELLIIKADNDLGSIHTYFNSSIAKGIIYAVDNGADIINLSLGSISMSPEIRDAVEYAHESHVIVVASAGNEANDKEYYPAALENSIAVGAINEDYSLSYFSNYGDYIDVVAPGSWIRTTDLNNGYNNVNGTSFSAPLVTGALALLLSYKDVSYYEAIAALKGTTVDLGEEGKDNTFGYGLIDVFNLLNEDYVTITFDTNEIADIEPVAIKINEKYEEIIILDSEDIIFNGWYLDQDLTIPYTDDYVFENDTTLYADIKFIYYTVSFFDDMDLIGTIKVASGDTIDTFPNIQKTGQELEDWYYSLRYIDKYKNETIKSNTKLYAKFITTEVKVTFLDALGDIFYESYIPYGSTFIPQENPIHPPTDIFLYEFYSWDKKLSTITKDTIFNPIYKRIFISNNVSLNPGIDTIYVNEEWNDSGITLSNDNLAYEISGQVNNQEPGKNTIVYEIYYESDKIFELKRIVNVFEDEVSLQIEISPAITTVIAGADFSIPEATTNYGEIEVISNINLNTPGKYKITYRAIYNDLIVEKDLYVYVIESHLVNINQIDWYLGREEEDDE